MWGEVVVCGLFGVWVVVVFVCLLLLFGGGGLGRVLGGAVVDGWVGGRGWVGGYLFHTELV